MLNCQVWIEKLPQIKQSTCLLKMSWKSQKHLIQVKSHFEEDDTKNYLVFQPMHKYFRLIANTKHISEWQCKGLFDETIKPPATPDNSLSPLIDYLGNKIRLKFNRGCLKPDKITYTHGKTVNIYIAYELGASSSNDNDPTLKNSFVWCN